MRPRANKPCGGSCPGTQRSTCSEQEFNRARMIVRVCDRCGKLHRENLPVRTSKPSEVFRGRLISKAARISADLRAGRLKFITGYWVPTTPAERASKVQSTEPELSDAELEALDPGGAGVRTDIPVLEGKITQQAEIYKEGLKHFTPVFDHEGE